MKDTFGIALVGCGTVGGGTALILTRDEADLRARTGLPLKLKKVVDVNFDHARKLGVPESLFTTSLDEALADPEVKVVIELVGGLTFAKSVFEKALKAGRHVVTANKALLATHGPELFALARSNGVSIGFEASCAGGIPVVRTITEDLQANRLDAVYGITNGTCNFILTEMIQKGAAYDVTLKKAQELGYAEADPTLDVSGMDTAHKITILGSLAFARRINLADVRVRGIQNLDKTDVALASAWGYNVKLIASAERLGADTLVQVQPTLVPENNLLARIWGSFNAVSLYGSAVGHTLYYGRGAGALPTASAVVGDLIGVASGAIPFSQKTFAIWPDQTPPARLVDPADVPAPFFVRLTLQGDGKAQLAQLAGAGLAVEQSKIEGSWLLAVTKPVSEKTLTSALKKVEGAVSWLPILADRVEFPAS